MTQLTKHFSLEELNPHGFPLSEQIRRNLKRVAENLEIIREWLGNRPINPTSGYRSPAYNKIVGGVKNSYHPRGLAVDFTVKGMTPRQVQGILLVKWTGGLGLGKTFTHIDLGPRRVFGY